MILWYLELICITDAQYTYHVSQYNILTNCMTIVWLLLCPPKFCIMFDISQWYYNSVNSHIPGT